MNKRICLIATLLALAATTRGVTNDLSGMLQKGLFEEEANRNIDAAISNYQSLANAFDKDRQLAATAIFRLGECYRKLGQTNEAAAQYQRIVREFSDQQTLVTLSRQNLAGLGASSSGQGGGDVLSRLMQQRQAELQGDTVKDQRSQWETVQAEAKSQYIQTQELLKILKQLDKADQKKVLPTMVTDGEFNALTSQLDAAEQNLLSIKSDYSTDHPKYQNAKEQVDALQHKIDERMDAILVGLQAKVDAEKASLDTINAQVEQATSSGVTQAVASQAPITDEEQQEIRRIQVMIQNSPDLINAPSGDPLLTPLCRAARLGQLRVAKFLIDAKADVNQVSDRMTPLGRAAANGQRAMVQLLLANGADVNGRDSDDCTALHDAADRGFISVAETLLEAKADVNAQDVQRNTPLILAVKHNFEPVSALLLAHGADPNLMATLPRPGYAVNPSELGAPLHFAIMNHNEPIVSLLLSNHADIEFRDPSNKTPLEIAVEAKKTEIARLLLDVGANPNPEPADSRVAPPLYRAADKGDTNMVSLLLSKGADPNYVNHDSENHLTALMIAVWGNHPQTATVLLRNKADPNFKGRRLGDFNGSTAFWYGLSAAGAKSLVPLLEYGADPNQTNDYNELSPLMGVVESGQFTSVTDRVAVAKLLIEKGANVYARNSSGDTALHLAVAYKRPELVELLLAHKASVNVANKEGKTPLNIATGSQGPQIGGIRPPMFMGVNSGTLTLNNNGANDSTPKIDMVTLLREHGALDALPDFNHIRVMRQGNKDLYTVFTRGSNDWNKVTLFDALGEQYELISSSRSEPGRPKFISYGSTPLNFVLPFPDFSRIVIHRPSPDGTSSKDIKVDAAQALESGNCAADVPLEFGDIVEIPEADHQMFAQWIGLDTNTLIHLSACLTRHVKVTVKGKTADLTIAPEIEFPAYRGTWIVDGPGVGNGHMTQPIDVDANKPLMLWPALEESKLLLASSDLARIKVTRRDSKTGKTREWTVDCSNENDRPNFWLSDGDAIEVPDKPGD